MNLQELKKKTPSELITQAEKLEIENPSTLRKQEILFAILKKLAQKIVGIKPKDRLSPDEKELADVPKIKGASDKLENDEDTHTEYKEKYFLTEEDKRSIREENFKASDRDQKIAITENEKSIQLGISKGICAFLDTEGGTLSIGVHDDGRVLGIERDFDVLLFG